MINRIVYIVLVCCCCTGFQHTYAQTSISRSVLKSLQIQEDSLKVLSDSLVNAGDPATRLRADSQFIRTLVRSLKMKHSFYYPFDSLIGISRLYSPDSTFRILTWQYKKDDYIFLHEGAIQMNQPDGSLKLYPLFDVSMFTAKPLDSIRSRRNWVGAIYYRIIQKTYQGVNYYTLLGFDDYTRSSSKKWMEVMTFSRSGEPVFGGPYFSFQDDSVRRPMQFRYNIEFKKEANTRFNYDPQLDMVLYDHLVSEGDQPERKDSYVPDGDFEAFKWKDGVWVHVEKQIFNFKLKDGQFPQEATMMDDNGGINEQKLQEQSEKNIQNAEKEKAKKTTTPARTPAKPVKKPQG
ncbi:MAG TPA: hypothetical protein VHD83_01965 [Puia sp.]|nr:hypothetical protein [Puia sp.]